MFVRVVRRRCYVYNASEVGRGNEMARKTWRRLASAGVCFDFGCTLFADLFHSMAIVYLLSDFFHETFGAGKPSAWQLIQTLSPLVGPASDGS